MSHHHHHKRSSSVSSVDNNYYSGYQQPLQQQQHTHHNNNNHHHNNHTHHNHQQHQQHQQIFNNNNNINVLLDQNFDVIKNEHNNLSELVSNIYNSLNSYCSSIKDIYLNSNSFINNVQKLLGEEHPMSKYGNGVLMMANQSFGEWMNNQETNFQMLGEYCNELEIVKSKIERVDQLSLELSQNNIDEYIQLKDEVFRDVSNQFESRVSRFDIPLINTQFSLPSLYQCLNSIHETNGNEQLQQPIEISNPVLSLLPDNTIAYNQIQLQQQQQEVIVAQQPIQVQQQPIPRSTPIPRSSSTNNCSNTMLLSPPVKTEIPYAAPPKNLQKLGVREYGRTAPTPQQPSPLKPLARPPPSSVVAIGLPSNSLPPSRALSTPADYQPSPLPQPSAPPQQQQPPPIVPLGGRQVLPHNPNSNNNNNNNNSNDNSSGVISQPLRPPPHSSIQGRFGGVNKPPLPQQSSTPNVQTSQPLPRPLLQQQSQPNLQQQQSPPPRPQPPLQQQQPSPQQQQPIVRPRSSSLSNNQSFSRPLPTVLNSNNNNNNIQQ